jgi:hypothetical protein
LKKERVVYVQQSIALNAFVCLHDDNATGIGPAVLSDVLNEIHVIAVLGIIAPVRDLGDMRKYIAALLINRNEAKATILIPTLDPAAQDVTVCCFRH